ncbi:hypothetical protein GCM10011414_12850 [Croceivirga lutea]|uniref:DUF1853 family protein n=1 Tax=Croceivirga lutea TaxID=1775167 RepID=UPI00163AA244|nr:DUF1853 family protein [Croceivirga lutea]GGG44743.1 hypothetical protein GCM10011414_12850 [Croceivirga lutea]
MNSLLYGFLNTPPLWKKQQFGLQQFEFPNLSVLDSTPLNLPDNLRLGHQMELLFKHLISSSENFKMVFSNLLIDEGKLRIGELDFILRDSPTQKHLHVELAYKFYVIDESKSEPIYRLVGPNKHDMFFTKLDKLKEKQIPLLHHPSLEKYWEASGINPFEIEQQCCFKAQLFEAIDSVTSIRPLNTDCIVGKWLNFDAFTRPEYKSFQYYIPKKIEWVINPHNKVPWSSHYETLLDINMRMLKEQSPMIWVKKDGHTLKKWFVVWW